MEKNYCITGEANTKIELHNIEKYQIAMQKVRDIRKDINSLEKSISPDDIKEIASELSGAILEVVSEIYSPLIDEKKKQIALFSPNDYRTDFHSLQEIPKYFE